MNLTIYYEMHGVSGRYFIESLRQVKNVFGYERLQLFPINSLADVTPSPYSVSPRVFLIHGVLRTSFSCDVFLNGFAYEKNNIATVQYQRTMVGTIFLIVHELAHLRGLSHCKSKNCVMGVERKDATTSYAWMNLVGAHRKVSTRLFCKHCRSALRAC